MRRTARYAALLGAVTALAGAAPAQAEPYLPPPGKVFAGVTGGYSVDSFAAEVGHHPPVFQFFTYWGGPLGYVFDGARRAGSRPMLHVSTFSGRSEVITPRQIAMGEGDADMLALNRRIDDSGQITYIRLMSEMNGHWNVYCAYSASGRSRGPSHSTKSFRAAWRRTVLIVRGGPVAEIDRRLSALGLPPVRTGAVALPRPRVAFQWVPQVAGAPDTRANSPRAYWPGSAYVDWVGTDFYSKFPNFSGLERFYRAFPRKPFVFGEWAMWGRDDPSFVRRLFRWSRSHGRTRMLMYNQGKTSPGTFRLRRYPRARAELRRQLQSPRFSAYAPELAP